LLKIISSLQFLACQGLAIRGHDNDDGNFRQLIRLREEDCPELIKWKDNRRQEFLSWTIQNELLELMSNAVVRKLTDKIRSAGMYSVIVDGTTDITHMEQESIVIRYVDEDLSPNEVFLGFCKLSSTDAATIASMILDILVRLNLPLTCLRGQSYDGASNMSGKFNGTQALITKQQPLAPFVHCLMHCGNLVASEAMESTPIVRDQTSLANDVASFSHQSTKLSNILRTVQKSQEGAEVRLKSLCPTRVLCRGPALKVIFDNLPLVLEALENYAEESKGDPATKARGLISGIERGEFVLGIKIAMKVLSPLEMLNVAVQSRKSTVSGMIESMKVTKDQLESFRTEESFHTLFAAVERVCTDCDLTKPQLPRQRRQPKKFDNIPQAAPQHTWTSAEEMYRGQYFQVLDTAISALERRYKQPGLDTYLLLESVLLTQKEAEEISAIVQKYPEVCLEKLVVQLGMYRQQGFPSAKLDDFVKTLVGMTGAMRAMFQQIEILVKLLLTLPCSSAEAERSFSAMRRLKTYLRGTMSQDRLNHLAILHVHRDLVHQAVDVRLIANDFIKLNEKRRAIFGTFQK
jgi:hypothetical protein